MRSRSYFTRCGEISLTTSPKRSEDHQQSRGKQVLKMVGKEVGKTSGQLHTDSLKCNDGKSILNARINSVKRNSECH